MMNFLFGGPSPSDRASGTAYVRALIRLLAQQDRAVQRYNEAVARRGGSDGSRAHSEIRDSLQGMVTAVATVEREHGQYSPVPSIASSAWIAWQAAFRSLATASRIQLAGLEGLQQELTPNIPSVSALLGDAERLRQKAEAEELALIRKLGMTPAEVQAALQDALAVEANAPLSAAAAPTQFLDDREGALEQWHTATSFRVFTDRFFGALTAAEELFEPFDLWKHALFTSVVEIATALDAVSPRFRDESAKPDGWREAQPSDAIAAILALLGYFVVESIEERDRFAFDRAAAAYRLVIRHDEHAPWLERLFTLHSARRRDLDEDGMYLPSGIEWQLTLGVLRGEYPPLPAIEDAAERGSVTAMLEAGFDFPELGEAIGSHVRLGGQLSMWHKTLSTHSDETQGAVLRSVLGL